MAVIYSNMGSGISLAREGPMPFTLVNPIGRLVQVRMNGIMSLEEAQQIRTTMYLLLSRLDGKAVIFTDMLQAQQFSDEVGERLIEMMLHDNPKVERSGFLMKPGPFALMIDRVCTDAAAAARAAERNPPPRRVFFEKIEAFSWLGDTLSAAERVGLRTLIEHAH
jgi:hypothetical protein